MSRCRGWRLGVVVCLACVLAGCGGSAVIQTDTVTPTTPIPTPAPSTPAGTTPQRDGTVHATGRATATTGPTGQSIRTAVGATASASVTDGDRVTVTITEVVDGDTMHIAFSNGSTDTVRLLGVDTPEVHVETQPEEFEGIPNTTAGRTWLRRWGHRASAFARQRLLDERVSIATSPRADRRGRYDRLLVTVRHDGSSFNRALLAHGYARVYDGPFATGAGFERTETRARHSETGLWGFHDRTLLHRRFSVEPFDTHHDGRSKKRVTGRSRG